MNSGKMTLVNAGLLTSLQDSGRIGYRKYGVPQSGYMDQQSAQFANLLVGNEVNTPVLEITQIGPLLTFTQETVIAICGADLTPMQNGLPVQVNHCIGIKSGDEISFGIPKQGIRAYLAIKGGWQTEPLLGSSSMYAGITTRDHFHSGDFLNYLPVKHFEPNHSRIKWPFESHFSEYHLMAEPGPEFSLLTEAEKQILFTKAFTIGTNSRMGYQLFHELMPQNTYKILTAPVIPGTVQLTPSGKLMALMRDAQVTGGYPRILQLKAESINLMSQKGTGMTVKFVLSA